MSTKDFTHKTCKRCGGTEFNSRGDCSECHRVAVYASRKGLLHLSRESQHVAYQSSVLQRLKAQISRAKEQREKEQKAAAREAAKAVRLKKQLDRIQKKLDREKAAKPPRVLKTPEQIAETRRKYREQNREKINAKKAEYRAENKRKVADGVAAWKAANKDRVKALNAAWRAANPHADRIKAQTRRARKKACGGSLSKDIIQKLMESQHGLCTCCGKELGDNYHLDHIMPFARGGSNTDDNVQLLRAECNQKKHSRDPAEFMQTRVWESESHTVFET